jgi:hypothetical protein
LRSDEEREMGDGRWEMREGDERGRERSKERHNKRKWLRRKIAGQE